MLVDAAQVGPRGAAQACQPGVGQDGFGAAGIGQAGSRSTRPSATSRSMSRVTPLLLRSTAVGQLAHPDAPLRGLGDRQQRVVLGERQVVLGAQLLIQAPRDPGVGAQEGAPRLEARVAGGQGSR